jgi:hypothetical protein
MSTHHRPQRSTRAVLAAIGVTLLLAAGACSSDSDAASSDTTAADATTTTMGTSTVPAVTAPVLSNPTATATELVTAWLETLQAGESVADLMAPNFQIQRADGSFADREQYLANPATVSDFTLGDTVTALQSGNTLSVRWSIKITEVINGVQYTDVEAPRLTVFEWTGDAWQIVGYGNFNPEL